VVWRSLPDPAGYATPVLTEHRGRPLLVCWTPTNVRGLTRDRPAALDGPFAVTYGTAIATPICADGIVLVSGYYEGTKAIKLGDSPPRRLRPGRTSVTCVASCRHRCTGPGTATCSTSATG